MAAPSTSAAMEGGATVRRCLVTGDIRPKAELIRFVLDPQHHVVPDIAGRLPGRGLWVSALRSALIEAVRKNLFSRAAKAPAKADPSLPAQVEQLLGRRCLELLGLAKSAGLVVIGQPQVEEALKANKLACVLMAADAGKDARKKLAYAKILPNGFTRAQLGEALGRGDLAAVGIRPHALTTKLETEWTRWRSVSETLTTGCKDD